MITLPTPEENRKIEALRLRFFSALNWLTPAEKIAVLTIAAQTAEDHVWDSTVAPTDALHQTALPIEH